MKDKAKSKGENKGGFDEFLAGLMDDPEVVQMMDSVKEKTIEQLAEFATMESGDTVDRSWVLSARGSLIRSLFSLISSSEMFRAFFEKDVIEDEKNGILAKITALNLAFGLDHPDKEDIMECIRDIYIPERERFLRDVNNQLKKLKE